VETARKNHAYIFNSVHRINRKLNGENNLFLQEWRPFVISLDLKFLFDECGTHKNWCFHFIPSRLLGKRFNSKTYGDELPLELNLELSKQVISRFICIYSYYTYSLGRRSKKKRTVF
jgi:hypothetical protein